jgi:hypothetical protein
MSREPPTVYRGCAAGLALDKALSQLVDSNDKKEKMPEEMAHFIMFKFDEVMARKFTELSKAHPNHSPVEIMVCFYFSHISFVCSCIFVFMIRDQCSITTMKENGASTLPKLVSLSHNAGAR